MTGGTRQSMPIADRQDLPNLRSRAPAPAASEYAGIPRTDPVPNGADGDAVRLRRPPGEPADTLPAHDRPARRPLHTGQLVTGPPATYDGTALRPLSEAPAAAMLSACWLASQAAAVIAGSHYAPHSAVRAHTVQTAALLGPSQPGHVGLHVADAAAATPPLPAATRDKLQVGGGRHDGGGRLRRKDTQVIDREPLAIGRIAAADALALVLVMSEVFVAPVLAADGQAMRDWWGPATPLRRRRTHPERGHPISELPVLDHGQVVGDTGERSVATARIAITREGGHAQYRSGLWRLRPVHAAHRPPFDGPSPPDATEGKQA